MVLYVVQSWDGRLSFALWAGWSVNSTSEEKTKNGGETHDGENNWTFVTWVRLARDSPSGFDREVLAPFKGD
jgi:hypothetical protein